MSLDPYAEAPASRGFLHRLNPLAKLVAPLPAMVLLVFVRDLLTPLAFIALAYAILLVGMRMTRTLALLLFAGLPAVAVLVGLGLSIWTDPAQVPHDVVVVQLGGWTLYGGAVVVGFATALRLVAIIALALVAGMSTTGPDLARSLVQQLRVPYRVGYTAIAAFRFVPRFGHELDLIRQAHRVRGPRGGLGPRGRTLDTTHKRRVERPWGRPFAAVARWYGYVVPLLAGSIRHAERVALAMDARAFGAYPTRTERHLVPLRTRDVVFVVLLWAASAALFLLA
jgi:energy-coupling factor transport system permease protein